MNDDILKYIKNEKEIAEYNKAILQRKKDGPAKKRLITIEEEFVNLPLEDMNFSSIEEVERAIKLYRKSRKRFYSEFEIKNPFDLNKEVNNKIAFLEDISEQLSSKRIEEINLVQDNYLFKELTSLLEKKSKKIKEHDLRGYSLDELKSIEPLYISKKRAKLQISMLALSVAIKSFLKDELCSEGKDIEVLSSKIDTFVSSLEDYVFKYFNDCIEPCKKIVKNTMGDNDYLDKVYYLDNIFSFYNNTYACVHTIGTNQRVDFDRPKLINAYSLFKNSIYKTYTDDKEKQTKNRVWAIIFPIERKSREKMSLLYKKITINNIDVSQFFCSSISNIRVKNSLKETVYYKGILMKPLWNLLDISKDNPKYREILSLIIGESLDSFGKFDNPQFVEYFNNKSFKQLDIDISGQLLAPKTRSEEQLFDKIMPLLKTRIDDIRCDFQDLN